VVLGAVLAGALRVAVVLRGADPPVPRHLGEAYQPLFSLPRFVVIFFVRVGLHIL